MKVAASKYAECLYFASNALARKTERLAQDVWSRVSLSPSHAYLLMLVLEKPGIQPGALAEELHLQPSTITRLIEKLESKRLVTRNTEGKTTIVHPTAKAKELLPRMRECVSEFYTQCTALMGKDELARAVTQVGKVADKFKT